MSRHRWFYAKLPFGLDRLSRTLVRSAYTAENEEGFIVDRLRDDILEARYIQQIVIDETIVDPFGAELRQRRVAYGQTAFVVYGNRPILEVVDAGRYTQRFVSRMLEVTDFDLVLSPIRVSIDQWATQLLQELEADGFVSELHIGGVALGDSAVGEVTVTGDRDVTNSVGLLLGGRRGMAEQLKVSFRGEIRGAVRLFANASARISASSSERVIDVVRRTLPDASIT